MSAIDPIEPFLTGCREEQVRGVSGRLGGLYKEVRYIMWLQTVDA
jgi:hypothetical protein